MSCMTLLLGVLCDAIELAAAKANRGQLEAVNAKLRIVRDHLEEHAKLAGVVDESVCEREVRKQGG